MFSKEAIITVVYKQAMWMVYNYREEIKAATNKISNLKKAMCKVFIHMSGVNKTYETKLDH